MEYREFRAESVGVDGDGVVEGLVTPFGRETIIGDLKHGGFREEVAKGCFAKTLREGDPLMVYQHEMSMPLARKSAGNLDIHEGAYQGQPGLVVKATPVDTTYARDMRALAQAKVLGGFSFGFNVVKDDWFNDQGQPSNRFEGTRRVLREVQLIEVSPVTRPAYKHTVLVARDDSHALLEERERRAPKPYGNVKYADPKNGKYPIDTAKHIKAAWSYINVAKNAAKYPLNGVSLASVKSKIKAAAKRAGIKISANRAEDFDVSGYCPRHGFEPCEHRCEDAMAPETRIKKSVAKRVIQMHAELGQALDLFNAAGIDKLPQQAQDAIALVSAAATHSGHVIKKEKLKGSDAARSKQKPDASTSATDSDDALRARARLAAERSRELGFG